MKATVLDVRNEGDTACYLCKVTLEEYISSLSPEYRDYDIQREIVKNVYLDRLVETVLNRGHIPPIVLVGEAKKKVVADKSLTIDRFKILDGLQRTFRLQAIRNVITYAVEELKLASELVGLSKFKFSRQYSEPMREINATTDILRKVLDFGVAKGEEELLRSFTDNTQWFEIWVGLTPDVEVDKMLTLNAGHKPVNTQHQMELLFLNLLPILREEIGTEFELVREKQIRSAQFSKVRKPGQIHFAHLIAGLLSLHYARPKVASPDLIQTIQEDEVGIEEYAEITKTESLCKIVAFLLDLDKLVTSEFGADGTRWMGREVILAGLFGAIGKYSAENGKPIANALDRMLDVVKEKPALLTLNKFEEVRNSLDLSKINFGAVNRTAVFKAIYDLLKKSNPSNINWKDYFRTGEQ